MSLVPQVTQKLNGFEPMLEHADEGMKREIETDIALCHDALDRFLRRWPSPSLEILEDRHEPRDIPPRWHDIDMIQSLPREPMTLLNRLPKWDSVLFWESQQGTIYRVPNIHYNQMGRCVYRWDPVYDQADEEQE